MAEITLSAVFCLLPLVSDRPMRGDWRNSDSRTQSRHPHSPLFFIFNKSPLGSLGRFRHYSPWYLLFSMSVAPQSLAQSVICLGRQEHKKDGTALTRGLAACRGRKHLRHAAPAHSWWAYHREGFTNSHMLFLLTQAMCIKALVMVNG